MLFILHPRSYAVLPQILYEFPNTVPYAAPTLNFSSEPGTQKGGNLEVGDRKAAPDRTHTKGGELWKPAFSTPNIWDRWEDAPQPSLPTPQVSETYLP